MQNYPTGQASTWEREDEWMVNHSFDPKPANLQTHPNALHLSEKGVATILVRQSYQKLFYDPKLRMNVPIQKVTIKFLDDHQKQVVFIDITNQEIIMGRDYSYGPFLLSLKPVIVKLDKDKPLFPDTKQAPSMLRKKIWVQINKLSQTLRIATGDVANFETEELFFFDYNLDLGHQPRDNWKHQEDIYPMPDYKQKKQNHPPAVLSKEKPPHYNPRVKNILGTIAFVEVEVQHKSILTGVKGQTGDSNNLSNFLEIKCMNLVRNLDSALELEPSILNNKAASLSLLPNKIGILYDYLKSLQVTKLPDFNAKPGQLAEREAYLSWKYLQSAVHFSLTTPYGYKSGIQTLTSTEDKRPIGILNHLFKLKYRPENAKNQEEGRYKKLVLNRKDNKEDGNFSDIVEAKNDSELMDYIYNKRVGYIRLEMLDHDGLAPGSMGVLEVWPPYYCSPIHNHADGYGLIKVLAGQIRVENFPDLTFKDVDNPKPFQKRDYIQNQYTWLSEESYGIHRLLNLNDMTCLNLQAYYFDNESAEYFECIDREQGKQSYIEFYPQNDWKDYLNIPTRQRQQIGQGQAPEYAQEDIDFIDDVIKIYGLDKDGPQINHQFYKLVLVMREEYEFAREFEKRHIDQQWLPRSNKPWIIYQIGRNIMQEDNLKVNQNTVESIKLQKNQFQTFISNPLNVAQLQGRKVIFIYSQTQYNQSSVDASAGIEFMKRMASQYDFPPGSYTYIYYPSISQGIRFPTQSISCVFERQKFQGILDSLLGRKNQ